jgi:LysM repeat protein
VLIFSAAQSQEPIIALETPFKQPAITKVEEVEPITNETAQTESQSDPKPEPKPEVVSAKQGDSLSSIADKYQTTWKRLYDKNEQIIYPDVIHVGERITIPDVSEKLTSRTIPSQPSIKNTYTTAAPKPTKISTRAKSVIATGSGSVWDKLAHCESSGNWGINTGNGYYGGLQFTLSSWRGVGGSGLPSDASRSEQIARAKALQARQGWGAWPACSAKLGLR